MASTTAVKDTTKTNVANAASPSESSTSVQPTNGATTTLASPAVAGGVPGEVIQPASLYVGDIHPDVTEALLFDLFNAVGPVASIRVCRDAVTRRSLGYAYVNYHNIADAERCLDTMNFTTIKGIPCRIMWSQRDPTLRRSGQGNIFVKNLDPSIDNKALYDTFSLFGNILSCKVAMDGTGESKGYGYVHYETAEAATEAISKINGMLIAGQQVFVGEFQRRVERPDSDEFTNCYAKNINKSWKDEDLRKEFEEFGSIVSCAVMKETDENTGSANRGFGFINFELPESAKKAVEALNGKKFKQEDGTELEMYVGKAQKKADRERELRSKFEALKAERVNKYEGVNLYVKNLDDQVSDEDLREAFAGYGAITSCRVMKTGSASRGFGFVCMSTPEEATKAVTEMNGKLLNGKPIFVALAQRKEVRRAQLEAHHAVPRVAGMVPGRGMPLGQPPMYGAAPMFYAQPNQMPPQARQGFVYPQQMMPHGPMPYGAGGAGYGMPGYGMPMQPRQQQGQQRRQQRQNGNGNNMNGGGRGGAPQNRNFKYTANARNQQPMQQHPNHHHQQHPNHQQQLPGAPMSAMPQPPIEPLTPAALAAASPEMQKNMIGERLYPLIHREQPELAGKITGMLLEMDNGELLHLLESPGSMASKIQEAMGVLQSHGSAE